MRNLITDVAGVQVGQAEDTRAGFRGHRHPVRRTGRCERRHPRWRSGQPRDRPVANRHRTVERIDALALSGGSAFGLEAGAGVQAWLHEQGRGFAIRSARVPIVPGAILFDLLNGGDKDWGRFAPYRELGYAAATAASDRFALGSAGAGLGATTADLKGGIGSASAHHRGWPDGGCDRCRQCRRLRRDRRRPLVLGGAVRTDPASSAAADCRPPWPDGALTLRTKGSAGESTTLVVVATDATLTKAQARRLAVMAQTGLARSTLSGAHATRWRHRVCRRDLPEATQ